MMSDRSKRQTDAAQTKTFFCWQHRRSRCMGGPAAIERALACVASVLREFS